MLLLIPLLVIGDDILPLSSCPCLLRIFYNETEGHNLPMITIKLWQEVLVFLACFLKKSLGYTNLFLKFIETGTLLHDSQFLSSNKIQLLT